MGEIVRHLPTHLMTRLNRLRLSQLEVVLSRVIDCRDAKLLGLDMDVLIDDFDYSATQAIGETAISRKAEAILVPSATDLGDNLVIFPDNLMATSTLKVVGSRSPRLYVPRDERS